MTNEEYINRAANEWIKLFINKSNLNYSELEKLKNCIKEIIRTTIKTIEMRINDTKYLMCSNDYKERFIAEYHQTKERAKELSVMIEKFKKNRLGIKPKCNISLLELQLNYMNKYLSILEARAIIENVDLLAYELPF